MEVTALKRREFLAALASLGLLPPESGAFVPHVVHPRKPSPYADVRAHVAPGTDEFGFEKEALNIESRLLAMMTSGSLPLAQNFHGLSPFPTSHKIIGEGVAEARFGSSEPFAQGLLKWIESLGQVQRASFSVLPGNQVRYEIKSDGVYRVGIWKQVWTDGRIAEFSPVTETRAARKEPLFQDITGTVLHGVESFEQQLLKGNSWWRARLDSATGIDIYGSNGIAAGDMDNDGRDEIYICQPGGLPNRLYKSRDDGRFEDITERAAVGVLDNTTSALFVDFRNSGHQDLVVLRSNGPLLFINNGDGTFTNSPDAFRFRTAPQGSFTGMAAADYDRDGRVDLYLCCYVYFQSEDQYQYPRPITTPGTARPISSSATA